MDWKADVAPTTGRARSPVPTLKVDEDTVSTLFPMFLKLEGRNCLVVGAGSVGEPKIASLIGAGARIRVVSLQVTEHVKAWHREGKILLEHRAFEVADLDRAFLVIAATNSAETNQFIFHEAQQRGILCNAVDDPAHCDFFYPAVVRRGRLQIAISTAGLSPALAQRLRRELELRFGEEYGDWLEELGRYRRQLFVRDMEAEERRQLLRLAAARFPAIPTYRKRREKWGARRERVSKLR